MFARIAERLTEELEDNQIITSEDRDLYAYGLNQGMIIILNMITTLCIGLLFGSTLQLVIFMAAYIPLRSYAGGYHARTPLKCYVISIIMLIAVSICLKCIALNHWWYWVLVVLSILLIIFLSPVEDKNKPLDEIEVTVYRKRAIIIIMIEVALSILFGILRISNLLNAMSLVFIIMSAMLVTGNVRNKFNFWR